MGSFDPSEMRYRLGGSSFHFVGTTAQCAEAHTILQKYFKTTIWRECDVLTQKARAKDSDWFQPSFIRTRQGQKITPENKDLQVVRVYLGPWAWFKGGVSRLLDTPSYIVRTSLPEKTPIWAKRAFQTLYTLGLAKLTLGLSLFFGTQDAWATFSKPINLRQIQEADHNVSISSSTSIDQYAKRQADIIELEEEMRESNSRSGSNGESFLDTTAESIEDSPET